MNARRMAWWIAAAFWSLLGVSTGFQVWISMLAHHHSIPLLVGYYVAVYEGWLLATLAIVWLSRRWPVVPLSRPALLVHFLAACVIAVLHGLYWFALLGIMKPFDSMTSEPSQRLLREMLFTRLPLEWLLYCLVLGGALAVDFYERYRERDLQALQLEKLLGEARMHALELQIQPHFLFNTLNAISGLVRVRRNDEAVAMIAGLSELLRYTLDHAGEQQVALEDELTILRRYLEIQRSRFPDRMSFEIDVADDARRGAVPTLLLQPLAENAMRHGIAASAAPGSVEVRAFRMGTRLRIDVFNTGALAPASPDGGIGLRNTRERLAHLYGGEASLELAASGGGVLASVSIPWKEVA
jgi:hypothetical protein